MKTPTLLAKGWLGTAMLFLSFSLLAQSPLPPSLTLIVEPAGTTTFDPVQNPTGHPFATDSAMVSVVLKLADTTDVSTIHIKLGTSANGTQLASQDFAFDVMSGLPNGTSYRREGYAVYLGLGSHSGFNSAYATVSLGNGSGTSANATASFQ